MSMVGGENVDRREPDVHTGSAAAAPESQNPQPFQLLHFLSYRFKERMQAIILRGKVTLIPSPSLSIRMPRSVG